VASLTVATAPRTAAHTSLAPRPSGMRRTVLIETPDLLPDTCIVRWRHARGAGSGGFSAAAVQLPLAQLDAADLAGDGLGQLSSSVDLTSRGYLYGAVTVGSAPGARRPGRRSPGGRGPGRGGQRSPRSSLRSSPGQRRDRSSGWSRSWSSLRASDSQARRAASARAPSSRKSGGGGRRAPGRHASRRRSRPRARPPAPGPADRAPARPAGGGNSGHRLMTRCTTPVYQRSGRRLISHRSRCSATLPEAGARASSALMEALLRTDRFG
jgi:hypothetical protein